MKLWISIKRKWICLYMVLLINKFLKDLKNMSGLLKTLNNFSVLKDSKVDLMRKLKLQTSKKLMKQKPIKLK